ncbi:MAG: HNH endonuclease [Bacillus sp. (in: firmicutes)]
MKNNYEIRGDDVVIFIESKKYGNFETIISKNQLQRAMEFPNTWYPLKDSKSDKFYVVGKHSLNGKKKMAILHRWLTHAPKGMVVDHINHDTLDNRFENLRVVTTSENGQNRRGAARHNKSRNRGVIWNKATGKWVAQIWSNRKPIFYKSFENKEDAILAVKEARKRLMPFSEMDISKEA